MQTERSPLRQNLPSRRADVMIECSLEVFEVRMRRRLWAGQVFSKTKPVARLVDVQVRGPVAATL